MHIRKDIILTAIILLPSMTGSAKGDEAFDNLFKDKEVHTAKGLMTIHKTDDNLYLEIPVRIFGQPLLSGTIVETSNNPLEAPAGYCPGRPVHFVFEKSDSSLLMKKCRTEMQESDDPQIRQAIDGSNIPVILKSFRIEAYNPDSTAVVIDATDFFLNDGEKYNPLDPKAYNSMEGYVKRDGEFLSENSFIAGMDAFEDNISVTSTVSFKVKSAFLGVFKSEHDTYLTADIRHSILLLPQKKMQPLPADPRVGTGTVRHLSYNPDQNGMKTYRYATRWDLNAGPVTFYIDDSFPDTWIPYIKASIDRWDEVLKENGCHDAIRYLMYSEAGPDFTPSDIRNTCIRYIPSPSGKIFDSRWVDPSTGQIIRADICINNGIREKIQKDLFLLTGGADPAARTLKTGDDAFGRALSSILLRNIGHCLGIDDNLAGSRAFPVDSLCSVSFTSRYGISASVMDELPFNFIADEKAVSEGVAMLQEKPGVYDGFVISYLYGQLPQETGMEEIRQYLKEKVDRKAGQSAYHYGKPQDRKAFFDPRAMVLDLGDNSMKAAEKGFKGLERIARNAGKWIGDEDIDYTFRQSIYDELVNLSYEYVKQVFVNVGGIYINERTTDRDIPMWESVPKKQQRDFLLWIMHQVSDFSWMNDSQLAQDVGLLGSVGDFCQKYYSRFIFSQIGEMWVSESKASDPYTQLEAMEDVSGFVWRDVKSGKEPDDITKYQQTLFVEYLSSWAEDDTNSGGSSTIRYKTTPTRAHEWYGMLLETEKLVGKAEKRAKDETTRNHYSYLHWKIMKALE